MCKIPCIFQVEDAGQFWYPIYHKESTPDYIITIVSNNQVEKYTYKFNASLTNSVYF